MLFHDAADYNCYKQCNSAVFVSLLTEVKRLIKSDMTNLVRLGQ